MGSCISRPDADLEDPALENRSRKGPAWGPGTPAAAPQDARLAEAGLGAGARTGAAGTSGRGKHPEAAAELPESHGQRENFNGGLLPGSRPDSPGHTADEPLDLSLITGRSVHASGIDTSAEESHNKRPAAHGQETSPRPIGHVAAGPGGLRLAPDLFPDSNADAYGLPPLPDPATSMHGSMHGSKMYARGVGVGSVHGYAVRQGAVGRRADEEAGEGGSSMRGGGHFPAGTMSTHAGMGTGSLHGGSRGRPTSVALRALHAAKLRATKPALERHNVQIQGHGSELLVSSHAFGYNHSFWNSIVESLDPSKYRVVLYDLSGALGTDYDAFDFQRYSTLHGFAEDLLLLLSELGVEGSDWQCTFIGHQHSGMMGLLAAMERPKVFKRIIMISSTPRLLDAPGYEGSFALADLDQVFSVMAANYKTWSKGFAPVLNADDVKAPHVRDLTRQLFLLRPDVAFSNLKTAFACDVRDVLAKVSVQVHMLFLSKDQTVPQSVIQFMLGTIPNAYAEILPGDSLVAQPGVIAAAILRHASMPLRDMREDPFRRFGSIQHGPVPTLDHDDEQGFDVDAAPGGWNEDKLKVDIV